MPEVRVECWQGTGTDPSIVVYVWVYSGIQKTTFVWSNHTPRWRSRPGLTDTYRGEPVYELGATDTVGR